MIEDLGFFDNYLHTSEVVVVLLSEITKCLFKKSKSLSKAQGFWFLFPLVYSFLTVLAMHLGGEGSWNAYISDSVKVYGISTFLYESIAKRLFKFIGADSVSSNYSVPSSDFGTGFNSGNSSENSEEPSVKASKGTGRESETER